MPVQTILTGSPATAVVNFISWSKAYSVFPSTTFIHRNSYLLKSVEPNDWYPDPTLPLFDDKYNQRGWKSYTLLGDGEESSSNPIKPARRIGDRFTWTIPFNIDTIKWSKIPDYVLDYSTFNMVRIESKPFPKANHYEIQLTTYESYMLKFRYTCSFGPSEAFWRSLTEKLDELTRLELLKLPQKKGSVFYRTVINDPHRNPFRCCPRPPTGWTFLDDKVTEWYEEWEQLPERQDEDIKDGWREWWMDADSSTNERG